MYRTVNRGIDRSSGYKITYQYYIKNEKFIIKTITNYKRRFIYKSKTVNNNLCGIHINIYYK